MLKITFGGACQEVGRSSILVDAGDKILLDHGVKLSPHGTEYPLPIETNLDAVVISHAHMDHSGNLPHLFQKSNPLTFMTPPTLDLAKILWFDTLKIAQLEAIDAKFSKLEIARTQKYTFPLTYRKRFDITDNASLEFFDAGHIAGSAITKLDLRAGKKTVVYTGDFRADDTRMHFGADIRKIKSCDVLITESTYGNREHPDRKQTEKRFVQEVQDTIDRGGTALVSSFAVGRSAEMIDILHEYKLNADIYLDGMCQKAARVYLQYPQYMKNSKFLAKSLKKIHWVKNLAMRKKALKTPSVIVTTSGMLQGGPVHFYLPNIYNDENSKLFLTGFQVDETPGRILLDTGKISIDGIVVQPKMRYERFDFSSHAGQKELLDMARKTNPQKILCVHGDPETLKTFVSVLKKEGFDAAAPKLGEEVRL